MARRKTTAKRKTGTTAKKRRTTRRSTRRKKSKGLANFFVPLFFICCILVGLGFLMFMGYQTVTASTFFQLKEDNAIEISGIKHISKEEIVNTVRSNSPERNVWNADLDGIKAGIAKFPYAKDVSVSRVLPDKIRVVVKERVPVALVRLDGKDFWFDTDGKRLNEVKTDEDRPSFTMFGWSENEIGDNRKRIKLYLELLEEWKSYDLAKRVKVVDLSEISDPQAVVEDSGHTVRIILSEDKDYGKSLQKGIENIAGRGKEIKSIDMSGTNPIISYRDS